MTAWNYKVGDQDVETMQEQLANPDVSAESLVGLHFALARVFEKREDYETAWSHFATGNAARRDISGIVRLRRKSRRRRRPRQR